MKNTTIKAMIPALLFAASFAPSGAARGQSQPATTPSSHLEVTLSLSGGQLQASPGKGFADPLPADDPILLTVFCASGVNCTGIAVQTRTGAKKDDNWRGTAETQAQADFSASRATLAGGGRTLVLRDPAGREASVDLPSGSEGVRASPRLEELSSPLTGVPLADCDSAGALIDRARAARHAVFLVTPTGNVLRRTRPVVDETDSVTVYVQGPRRVVERIVVRRTSPFRQVGGFPIIGEEAEVGGGLIRESTRGDGGCAIASAKVENFAGDQAAVISLSVAMEQDDGTVENKPTGSFDFAVNRLYRGAFSLGVMRTELEDPTFTVAGTDSVIVSRNGGPRYLYALYFTPFLWGRRNAEEWSLRRLHRYVNPTVGVVVDEVSSNALGGATLELPGGVFLTAGLHAGKVTRLAPDSPPLGAAATGSPRQAVTEERWESEMFYSLSLDLRAAVKFLGRLTGDS